MAKSAFRPMSPAGIGIAVVLALLALLAVSDAWRVFLSYPLPPFDSCYVDKPDAAAKRLAAPLLDRSAQTFIFTDTDEGSYLRSVEQWRLGLALADSMPWAFRQVSPPVGAGDDYLRIHGIFRALAERSPATNTEFVSYRSVVFPLLGVPVVERLGCNSQSLSVLRQIVFAFRLALPLLVAVLVFLVVENNRWAKSLAGGVLVAFNDQLSQAASTFMPDVPSVAILLASCIALAIGHRRRAVGWFVLGGAMLGVLGLVKFDFIYLVPLALLVAGLCFRRHAFVRRALLAAFAVYVAIISAYAVRNHALTGRYFVTSKDSVNLWIGNSGQAKSRGYSYGITADELPRDLGDFTAGETQTLRAHGLELAVREYFRRRLTGRVLAEPVEVLCGVLDKAGMVFLNGGVNMYPRLGAAGHGLGIFINGLAWAGVACWAARRWRFGESPLGAMVVTMYVLSFAVIALVFFLPRYLAHVFTLAIIIAVCFGVDLGRAARLRARDGAWRKRPGWADGRPENASPRLCHTGQGFAQSRQARQSIGD